MWYPLACGIQTGAGSVLNVLAPSVGESIAIFGVGSVGLSAVMAARLVGAGTIVAVDLNESRLKMAMALGATHVVNGAAGPTADQIRTIMPDGVNYALYATGVPHVILQAIAALAPRGVCGLVGAPPPTGTPINLADIMATGKTIRGIVEGDSTPDLLIPRLVDLYRQGRFPFDKLVRYYELADINQAIEDSEKGLTVKPIIRMPNRNST